MNSLAGKYILRGIALYSLTMFCLLAIGQINLTQTMAQAASDSTENAVPFSLALNGNNAALSVAHNNSLSMSGAMTLEAWIKPNSTEGSQIIVDRMTQNSVTGSGGYQLRVDNGNIAFMICEDNLRIRCITTYGSTAIQANRWQHIAAVFENGKTRVYLNGQIDGQRFKTVRAAGFAVGDMTIGANSRGRGQFRGLIDELRICNTAVYNAGFDLSAQSTANQSTVGLWRFDGGSMNDSSSYNHQTAIVGMATFSPDVPAATGSGFIVTNTPNVGPSNELLDVKTISATDVWAVGSHGPPDRCCFPKTPVSLHWDGAQWNSVPVPLPDGFTEGQLVSVDAAPGSNNVWAVGTVRFPISTYGSREKGWLVRWDGTSWNTAAVFNDPAYPDNSVSSVKSLAVVNDNDLWVVGSRIGGQSWTLHWDGTNLTTIPSPNADMGGNALKDVSVINSNDVWAVGSFMVIRWNGTEWRIVPGNLVRGMHLSGVAAVSPSEVWAIGGTTTCGPFMGCSSSSSIIRYNGTDWVTVPVEQFPAQQVIIEGISASGSNNVWIAGSADNRTLVLRYDGTRFIRVQSENAPSTSSLNYDYLKSISVLNSNTVFTVGSFSEVFYEPQYHSVKSNLALRKSAGF